jgi:uncharacterized protein (DUF433 family)
MNYRDIITVDADKRGGKPCVRGLRTVYEVLEYLASEMTEAEILDDFHDLTQQDLTANSDQIRHKCSKLKSSPNFS